MSCRYHGFVESEQYVCKLCWGKSGYISNPVGPSILMQAASPVVHILQLHVSGQSGTVHTASRKHLTSVDAQLVMLACLQALLRLVYTIATAQAAYFTSAGLTGTASLAQVRRVLAPLLFPFLQRAHIVMCLITSASASVTRSTLPFCQQGKQKQLDGPKVSAWA